jgi:hypothetical protein
VTGEVKYYQTIYQVFDSDVSPLISDGDLSDDELISLNAAMVFQAEPQISKYGYIDDSTESHEYNPSALSAFLSIPDLLNKNSFGHLPDTQDYVSLGTDILSLASPLKAFGAGSRVSLNGSRVLKTMSKA